MAFSLPTADQVKAASRHAGTAVASVLGTLAALKIISAGDLSSLQASFDQISHGVAEFVSGVTALCVAATTVYAAISANPLWQLLRGSKAVSADPKLAASIPEATQKEMVKATDALPTTTAVVSSLAPDIPSPTVVTPEQATIKS
jgi:hypothetical protein